MNIISHFLDSVKLTPDRPWLTIVGAVSEETWTFGDVDKMLRHYAAYFTSSGLNKGDIVFIFADTDANAMAAFLGAILIGVVPAMMPPISPRQDPSLYWGLHSSLIEKVKPALIFAKGETYREGILRFSGKISELNSLESEAIFTDTPYIDEGTAFLQHSSGTTAQKKGVLISHSAALKQMAAYSERLAISEHDVIVSWLPLYHDMGLVACFLMAVRFCLPLVLVDPFVWTLRPRLFLDAVSMHRGTLAWMPNFAFNHMARVVGGEQFDLSSLRLLINCSEPCRPTSMQGLCHVLRPSGVDMEKLAVCYAMAETVFAVSQQYAGNPPKIISLDLKALAERDIAEEGTDFQAISAGPPLPGVVLRIVDESLRDLPDRHVGEIVVSAPFLFSGYNGLPAETAARLLPGGEFRTGDRGFMLDGEIYVLGRLDDVVIVNGKKIDANDIEHGLTAVDGLRRGRAVAFPVLQPTVGSYSLALVIEAENASAEMQRDLVRRVREYVYNCCAVTPAIIEIRPSGWIVKTTSGKINHKQNRLKFLAETGRVD